MDDDYFLILESDHDLVRDVAARAAMDGPIQVCLGGGWREAGHRWNQSGIPCFLVGIRAGKIVFWGWEDLALRDLLSAGFTSSQCRAVAERDGLDLGHLGL